MERSLIVAGFGGQGVMVCGQLLCYTAAETTDKNVTFFPSYGSEQRGGTASCFVTISDDPIGSPKPNYPDDAMILNDPSMVAFAKNVKPGGLLVINSSIVSIECDRTDIKVIKVPANDIAFELGNTKCANLVMVGAYIGATDVLPADKVKKTAEKKLGAKRPHLIPINNAAFDKGYEIGVANK